MAERFQGKASLTVEAAFVVPVVLMVLFLLLSLIFYMHEKVYYTLGAYEAAMYGAVKGRAEESLRSQYAEEKAENVRQGHRMPTEKPAVEINEERQRVIVTFKGNVSRLWGGGLWDYTAVGSFQIVQPEKRIRQLRIAEEIAEMWKEGSE